jgi:hypothetical protein
LLARSACSTWPKDRVSPTDFPRPHHVKGDTARDRTLDNRKYPGKPLRMATRAGRTAVSVHRHHITDSAGPEQVQLHAISPEVASFRGPLSVDFVSPPTSKSVVFRSLARWTGLTLFLLIEVTILATRLASQGNLEDESSWITFLLGHRYSALLAATALVGTKKSWSPASVRGVWRNRLWHTRTDT